MTLGNDEQDTIMITSSCHQPSISIAQLDPESPTGRNGVVEGIVTLVWPYASLTHSLSLLLVDPDFRLRRDHGQVRLYFFGPSARAVANAGIKSADRLVVDLKGALFAKSVHENVLPRLGIQWELHYQDQLVLQIHRDLRDTVYVDIEKSNASFGTARQNSLPPVSLIHSDLAKRNPSDAEPPSQAETNGDTWLSPAFLKRSSQIANASKPVREAVNEVHEIDRSKRRKVGWPKQRWKFDNAKTVYEDENPDASRQKVLRQHVDARRNSVDETYEAHIDASSSSSTTLESTSTTTIGMRAPSSAERIAYTKPDLGQLNTSPSHTYDAHHSLGTHVDDHKVVNAIKPSLVAISIVPNPELSRDDISQRYDQGLSIDHNEISCLASNERDINVSSSLSEDGDNTSLFEPSTSAVSQHGSFRQLRDTSPTPSSKRWIWKSAETLPQAPQSKPVRETYEADADGADQAVASAHVLTTMGFDLSMSIADPQVSELFTSQTSPRNSTTMLDPPTNITKELSKAESNIPPTPMNTMTPALHHDIEEPHMDCASTTNIDVEARGDDGRVHVLPRSGSIGMEGAIIGQDDRAIAGEEAEQSYDYTHKSNSRETSSWVEPLDAMDLEGGRQGDNLERQQLVKAAPNAAPDASGLVYSKISSQTLPEARPRRPWLRSNSIEAELIESQNIMSEISPRKDTLQILVSDSQDSNGISTVDQPLDRLEQDSHSKLQHVDHFVDSVAQSAPSPPATSFQPCVSRATPDVNCKNARVSNAVQTPDKDYADPQETKSESSDVDENRAGPLRHQRLNLECCNISAVHTQPSNSGGHSHSRLFELSLEGTPPALGHKSMQTDSIARHIPNHASALDISDPTLVENDVLSNLSIHGTTSPVVAKLKQMRRTSGQTPRKPLNSARSANPWFTSYQPHDLDQGREATAGPDQSRRDFSHMIKSQHCLATRPASQLSASSLHAFTLASRDQSLAISPMPREGIASPLPFLGLRTKCSYFVPLASLREYHSMVIDIMAIIVFCTAVERARAGSRDFHQRIHITDPSSLRTNSHNIESERFLVVAQLFRPQKACFPSLGPGDAIILHNVKVVAQRQQPGLISTDVSAWAVFRKDMHVQVRGPPIEFGPEERIFAQELWSWWASQPEHVRERLTKSPSGAR